MNHALLTRIVHLNAGILLQMPEKTFIENKCFEKNKYCLN